MSFIKLTGAETGEQFAVNTDQVISFFEVTEDVRVNNASKGLSPKANCVVQVMGGMYGNSLEVRENFDQVLRKVGQARRGYAPDEKINPNERIGL